MSKNIFPNEYPRRGEMYYVVDNPDKPSVGKEIWSNRIGLIVSNNTVNRTGGFVELVYLSTSPNKQKCLSPTHIRVLSGTKQAVALCEQIHSADNSRLQTYIGKISEEKMVDIEAGMLFGLEINRGVSPQGIFKKWEKYINEYLKLQTAFETSENDEKINEKEDESVIRLLTQERDSYKSLCQVLQDKLNSIHNLTT